jgi:CRISPR-associated protein Csb2
MSLINHPSKLRECTGQVVRIAFVDKQLPIQATVAIADAFRAAALAALHSTNGSQDSMLLSGHYSNGKPGGQHQHAYYLPEPGLDSSRTLTGLLVVSPVARFSEQELMALQAVTWLRWNGPRTVVSLECVGIDDWAAAKVASHWTSSTPYVPFRRFWGTHGKRHLTPERQIITELGGHPVGVEVLECEVRPWCDVRVRIAPSANDSQPLKRRGFHVTFSVRMPICGPVALGHSCHFGLGQFRPIGT